MAKLSCPQPTSFCSINRRQFLKTAGLLAAAPLILPRGLLCAAAPSKKIGIGMIGIGRQAYYANLAPFLKSPDCVVTALCDVDSWRLAQGMQAVEKHYQKKPAKAYRDFRELLADPNVDAVMISTPDHWHAPMAIAAVKAGKDVALEKPITRYINEGRLLAQLIARHKRVFRVDSEFRSLPPMHRAVELVRNGRLGKLHTVRTGVPREKFPPEAETAAPPPAELDYDLWLGPAPQADYIQKRVHTPHDLKSRPGWMRSRDYCDGIITNWGTHLNDIAQWGAGTERTGPAEVTATGKYHDGKVWDVLESFDASYKFANGVEMSYLMDAPHVRFEGDQGWIQVNYGGDKLHPEGLHASDPKILREQIGPGEIRFPLRSEKTDFIECIKNRGRTLEDEEVGQRTTTLCHLAHIAIQLGGAKLAWDPDEEQFPDNEAANQLINRPPMRAPWKLE
jgi:myo-inositol 2-dehydrogenase / D-chiro-inositol 1-dehydrogenase